MTPRLLAERFLRLGTREIVDLALGGRVWLRLRGHATPAAQVVWLEACARQVGRPGPGDIELVDYGGYGAVRRFEAYRRADRPARPGAAAPRTASGEAAGGHNGEAVQALVQPIVDLLDAGRHGEPRTVAWPVAPHQRDAALRALAREARLHGFVPVAVAVLERLAPAIRDGLLSELASRHVLLLDDTGTQSQAPSPGSTSALALLVVALGTASARPHLIVRLPRVPERTSRDGGAALAVRERRARYEADSSERAASGSLALTPLSSPDRAVARALARAQEGLRLCEGGRHAAGERLLRDAAGALARRDAARHAGWVSVGLGLMLVERGRTSDAVRVLEAAREHFHRCGDVAGGTRAAILLGIGWTDDARLAQGEAALRSALIAAGDSGDVTSERLARLGLVRCLFWQGRFEDARLHLGVGRRSIGANVDEADGRAPAWAERLCQGVASPVLAGTGALASGTRVADSGPPAAFGWRRTPAPRAESLLVARFHPEPDVLAACLASRLALARQDLAEAGLHASDALDRAHASGLDLDVCAAETAVAAVHAEIGDLDGLERHVRTGLAHARRAHAPLRAVRLRLARLHGLRRAGRVADARAAAARLSRVRTDSLPALLRSRIEAALAPAGSPGDPQPSAIGGLPQPPVVRAAARPADVVGTGADAGAGHDAPALVLAILRICEEEPDQRRGLERACRLLRERLGALAVTCYGVDAQALPVLAHDGPRPASDEAARRAVDAAMAIATSRAGLGFEAAAPVRFQGAVIGALAARWGGDALIERSRADRLLALTAAVAAPWLHVALEHRQTPGEPAAGEGSLIGESPAMDELRRAIARTALVPFPVLIEGESGSGKELVARAIHQQGPRRAHRFCALNCAAMPDELVDAELFGHARGAFTGALSERVGLFEEAHRGTLFLDEIADLSLRSQAKLLRVVQDGEVRRIGENHARGVEVRIVAASNRPLAPEVPAGRFRSDLLYRLDVIRIAVPPLRERVEDIQALAWHCWNRAIARVGSRAALSSSTLAALARYDWPGNVRELQNVMAALAVHAPKRGTVGPSALPAAIARAAALPPALTLARAREQFEQRFVRAALARAGGHHGRAAQEIGLSRQGLAKLIARLGLDEAAGCGAPSEESRVPSAGVVPSG